MGLRPYGGEARLSLLTLNSNNEIFTQPISLTIFILLKILLLANNY